MTQTVDAIRTRYREHRRDIDLLLSDLLGRSTAWLLAHGDQLVDEVPIDAAMQRRIAGEPLQYIRGRCEFYGREFLVDDRVLIPRPETELLVEAVLRLAPRNARIVDVGAGSGCIAITLQLERDDLEVVAIDRSLGALAVTRRNREALGARLRLAASDVLTSLRGNFDVVVSNPPYIPARDIDGLEVQVREHEPRMALTPGASGTEIIEQLFAQAGRATLAMEIGFGQEAAVRAIAEAHRFRVGEVIPDLAGIARVVVSSPAW
ncbi:MAG: protein-(glutamine-N5) methyltransferase, release factor-specific [Acidobacteria bacterium]|nr:protein-(glutamine-N5) methyltransferase, release factor-specific [Acidobacteriota bacterium]